MTCNCAATRNLINLLAESLQEFIDYEPVGSVDLEQDLIDEARAYLAKTEADGLAVINSREPAF